MPKIKCATLVFACVTQKSRSATLKDSDREFSADRNQGEFILNSSAQQTASAENLRLQGGKTMALWPITTTQPVVCSLFYLLSDVFVFVELQKMKGSSHLSSLMLTG